MRCWPGSLCCVSGPNRSVTEETEGEEGHDDGGEEISERWVFDCYTVLYLLFHHFIMKKKNFSFGSGSWLTAFSHRNVRQTGLPGRRQENSWESLSGFEERREQEGVKFQVINAKNNCFTVFVLINRIWPIVKMLFVFLLIIIAPWIIRGSTRTKSLALEAKRVDRSGTPKTASTTSPASKPGWLTLKEAKEGRKAKEENKTWVTHTQTHNNDFNECI